MSGHSYQEICPNCGEASLDCYTDNNPFEQISGECLNCGFNYWTKVDFYDQKELNEWRIENELKPLKKLPKQDRTLLDY